MIRLLIGIAVLCWSTCGEARWLKTSSNHFVIYADTNEKTVRTLAEKLERFDSALTYLNQVEPFQPSPSSRVTIYVLSNQSQVARIFGKGGSQIGGFYTPRAAGPVAFVPLRTELNDDFDYSLVTLLHEYTHHFMISNTRFETVRWIIEGSADFYASARFDPAGSVWLGRTAYFRAGELFGESSVQLPELFDSTLYARKHKGNWGPFYGRSWLLYHYLFFSSERRGQLNRYLRLMREGKSSPAAAAEAFGDPAALDIELMRYQAKPELLSLQLPATAVKTGPITVEALDDGEAAAMPVVIRSKRGVTRENATAILTDARAVAAKFPKNAAVLSALAEAEQDAGNHAEAVAAANAAISIDPKLVNPYVQKGLALFALAEKATDRKPALATARQPFVALNALENDHPLPLIYYYMSFAREGVPPTPRAIEALERATELAPFDLTLRAMAAVQQIRDHRFAEARESLMPIANNPHGGALSESARAVLRKVETDPNSVTDDDAATLTKSDSDSEDS